MIEFDDDNKLVWKKMSKSKVPTYIHFLNCEIARHMVERGISDQKSLEALPGNELLSELWRSACKRHKQDIHECEALIREVKEYFKVDSH